MSIYADCITALSAQLGTGPRRVSDVRVGVFYTAARLESGHAGVAFTPRDLADTVCCPRSAAEAPPAGEVAGQDAWMLVRYCESTVPLRRAIGYAVLNALSAAAMEGGISGVEIRAGADALDMAAVGPRDRVAMVGAFTPFIKSLKGRVRELSVIDKHAGALKADEKHFWRAPADARVTLSNADVALITGSALVEGGLEELLEAAQNARAVVLAGPTASTWPTPFFERGVDVMAGIRVRDPLRLLQIVSEGGSGYFFQRDAEKVCYLRSQADTARRHAASG